MIEEISPRLYRIQVSLPDSPLKFVNSYLIKDTDRSLLIDTGMNREVCLQELTAGLKKLAVDLNKTDIFVTHLHADHLGLAAVIATGTTKVYFNGLEAAYIQRPERWQEAHDFYILNGFTDKELEKSMKQHPGYRYGLQREFDFCILKEGDRVNIGDYSLACISTPGHSPGHLCLYDDGKQILFSGDHILFDITPNIAWWPRVKNSLNDYLTNLNKIYDLEVKLTLPGHRSICQSHKERIKELIAHHHNRANEIINALQDGPRTAVEIAPFVTWDVDYKSWEQFPPVQKWFAFGETLAHLIYLEEDGIVKSNIKDYLLKYSLKT